MGGRSVCSFDPDQRSNCATTALLCAVVLLCSPAAGCFGPGLEPPDNDDLSAGPRSDAGNPPASAAGSGAGAAASGGSGGSGGAPAGAAGTGGAADAGVDDADAGTDPTGDTWWSYAPNFDPYGNDHGRALPFADELQVPRPPATTRYAEVSSAQAFNAEAREPGTHIHVVADITDGNCQANADDLLITFEPGITIQGQLSFGSLDHAVHRIEVDGGDRSFEERAFIDADAEAAIGGGTDHVHSDIVLRRLRIRNPSGAGVDRPWSRSAIVDCAIRARGPAWLLNPSVIGAGQSISDLLLLGNTILTEGAVAGSGIDVGGASDPNSVTRFVAFGNHIETTGPHPVARLRSLTDSALVGNVLRMRPLVFGELGASNATGRIYVYDNQLHASESPQAPNAGPTRLEWLGNAYHGQTLSQFLAAMGEPAPGEVWSNSQAADSWGAAADANSWDQPAAAPAWPALPGNPHDL